MPQPDPSIGARVVLRYRLPEGSSHTMTDVIGLLVATYPAVVVDGLRGRVEVDPERVVALKPIPERPVRNRDIRSAEYAASKGWPGVQNDWIDGWFVRAGGGFTSRANSAVPLEPSAAADSSTLDRISHWYADRGLPVLLHIPDRLVSLPAGWTTEQETVFMTSPVPPIASQPYTLHVSRAPDDRWLSMYSRASGHSSAPDVVCAVVDGHLGFGSLVRGGEVVGIIRAAVTAAPDKSIWVGLAAAEIATSHRRQGLGEQILREMTSWAAERGASRVYLQVASSNETALTLYRKIGFIEHHRYRYARPADRVDQ